MVLNYIVKYSHKITLDFFCAKTTFHNIQTHK